MTTVKINNKTYNVPELTFRHSKMMEQMGLPIESIVSSKSIFTAVSVFTAIVANCNIDEADRLVEQHVEGGGDIGDIYRSYVEAVTNSGFFQKLIRGLTKTEEKPKKATGKSSQKVEAENE